MKKAFENGEIVEMEGSHHDDFDSLLGIAIPDITPVQSAESFVDGKKTVSHTRESTPTLMWEAARLGLTGFISTSVQNRSSWANSRF